jgi:hypothetical protein
VTGPQGTSINVQGSVSTAANLPLVGNSVNDAYIVDDNGDLYIWDGTNWNNVGQIVGPTGPSVTGPQGPQGPTGPTGANSTVPGPQGGVGPTGPRGGVLYQITSTGEGGSFFVAGLTGNNPNLVAVRGEIMYFDVSGVQLTNSLALRLSSGSTSNVPGTTNNSTTLGRNLTSTDTVIVWNVPLNAPSQIIYQDVTDANIAGVIDVVDKIGPTGATGATGSAGSPAVTTYVPVFSGTGFASSSQVASGTFSVLGRNISFEARVNFTSASSFGTGQYSITLPVLPNSLSGQSFIGVLDTTGDGVTNVRQIVAYADDPGSAVLNLWFVGSNSTLTALTGSAPVTITTNSRIYINGSFISNS